jgi:pilus assembly protein CpaE
MEKAIKKVFILGNSAFCEDSVRNITGQSSFKVVGVAYAKEEALILIEDLSPEILIVDVDINEGGINVGEQFKKQFKNLMVFIATDSISIDLVQRAIAKNLEGVIKKPINPASLSDTIEKVKKFGSSRLLSNFDDEGHKELLAFYSPKGGVGKTTLAVNLCGLISSKKGQKIKLIIVDFDVWANVQIMLQIKGNRNISDWVSYLDNFALAELSKYVVTHPLGFDIIPGIARITDAGIFTSEFTSRLFDVLGNVYDVIVVDMNSVMNDSTAAVFEKASRIFVIGTLEIPTLKGLNDLNGVMELLDIGNHKIRMVLNRIPEKPDISIKEVAQLIPFPLIAKIKEEPGVRASVNKGEIYAAIHPDSDFAKELEKLGAGIINAGRKEVTKRKKGFWGLVTG